MEKINTRATLEDLIASLKRKRERQWQSYNETHLQITMLQQQIETLPDPQMDIEQEAKKGKK